MATQKQIDYYKSLCEELDLEPEDSFSVLTNRAASSEIEELDRMAHETRREKKESERYWY